MTKLKLAKKETAVALSVYRLVIAEIARRTKNETVINNQMIQEVKPIAEEAGLIDEYFFSQNTWNDCQCKEYDEKAKEQKEISKNDNSLTGKIRKYAKANYNDEKIRWDNIVEATTDEELVSEYLTIMDYGLGKTRVITDFDEAIKEITSILLIQEEHAQEIRNTAF